MASFFCRQAGGRRILSARQEASGSSDAFHFAGLWQPLQIGKHQRVRALAGDRAIWIPGSNSAQRGRTEGFRCAHASVETAETGKARAFPRRRSVGLESAQCSCWLSHIRFPAGTGSQGAQTGCRPHRCLCRRMDWGRHNRPHTAHRHSACSASQSSP